MSWIMNDKEFESVISLNESERYTYFIKKVADWEEVWSLWSKDGWVLASDDSGHQHVPVWPHERFAAACILDEWAENEPRKIELSDWIERWIPGMIRDKRIVSVFPAPNGKSISVLPERLKDDLEEEISLYE